MRALTNRRKDRLMAAADLTAARLRELLTYDPSTGAFTWRARTEATFPNAKLRHLWNRKFAGKPARNSIHGYVGIRIEGRLYLAHRVAWVLVHGEWPNSRIDHINGDKSDNRMVNLREVSAAMNAENRRSARAGARSGLLGVQWNDRLSKWQAAITVGGKRRHLGVFRSAPEAHEAYLAAKRHLHAGCTI